MRLLAILPISLSITALVLTLLCVFAGSKPNFMADFALLTLNTSHIGQNISLFAHSDSPNAATAFFNDVAGSVQDDINDSVNSFARHLGVHDFYAVHILNFCEGYYQRAEKSNRTRIQSDDPKLVTSCSKSTLLFDFNPREAIGRELGHVPVENGDMAKLSWPTEVNGGLRTFAVLSRVMSVIYCVSLATIATALALSTLSILFSGRLSACVNTLASLAAALAAGIASILATIIGDRAADLINDKGTQIGISAQKGTRFIGITWMATACILVASFMWLLDCICGKRRRGPF